MAICVSWGIVIVRETNETDYDENQTITPITYFKPYNNAIEMNSDIMKHIFEIVSLVNQQNGMAITPSAPMYNLNGGAYKLPHPDNQ